MSFFDIVARRMQQLGDQRRVRRRHRLTGASETGAWPLVYQSHIQKVEAARDVSPGLPQTAGSGTTWTRAVAVVLAILVVAGAAAWAWYAVSDQTERMPVGHPSPTETATVAAEEELAISTDPPALSGPGRLGTGLTEPAPQASVPVESVAFVGKPLKQVNPAYPAAAKAAGIEGLVIVTYTIDTRGKPGNFIVTKSVPMLDGAVLDALRQWEYAPLPAGAESPNYRLHADFALGGVPGADPLPRRGVAD